MPKIQTTRSEQFADAFARIMDLQQRAQDNCSSQTRDPLTSKFIEGSTTSRQRAIFDRYGHPISDWAKSPPSPRSPSDTRGEIVPEQVRGGHGEIVDYEFSVFIQSTNAAQYHNVSEIVSSRTLKADFKPAAPGSEYGVFQIAGAKASLNLLCHCRTSGFAAFAQSCVKTGKLSLKIRLADGTYLRRTVELNGETASLTKSLTDAARLLEEYPSELPADCYGAVRNFDFYYGVTPSLAQSGGGYLVNALDTARALERALLEMKAAKGKSASRARESA
ncbi:hypothetical protein B0G80_8600 [Paraburkholderia sp. BL6669N2]|uniref:hypothetical protein n=1 Tax=Paraburkholderia sp. BL6669N2 TaxID=1938807 RepID=UPI000E392773|nr:hypothetical protein [Paraburkholderia sp. BL6669N2]REG52084.1 hypothetical protein B0G80_8600 [Paraburkholderia sp. BL6669N2]